MSFSSGCMRLVSSLGFFCLFFFLLKQEAFSSINLSENKNKLNLNIKDFEGLPSSLVSLGEEQEELYSILVEKKFGRMSVFKINSHGSPYLVRTYPVITGKVHGDKLVRGDNKTPEGLYFVVGEASGEKLQKKHGSYADKYGAYAFMLDYPNVYDRSKKKTGSGIWIHGVERNTRLLNAYDTEGCVALRNHEIVSLRQYIKHYQTPVIITDVMPNKSFESLFLERKKSYLFLDRWLSSWREGNYHEYKSFYHKSFHGSGKNKQQWLRHKMKLGHIQNSSPEILISKPRIVSFKNQKVISFYQSYKSEVNNDIGNKFLYLIKNNDGYKIISERWKRLTDEKNFAYLASKSSLSGYIEKMTKFHMVAFNLNQKNPSSLANKNPKQSDIFSKDNKIYSFQLAALNGKSYNIQDYKKSPEDEPLPKDNELSEGKELAKEKEFSEGKELSKEKNSIDAKNLSDVKEPVKNFESQNEGQKTKVNNPKFHSNLENLGRQGNINFYATANVSVKDFKYKAIKTGTHITFDLLKRNQKDKKKIKGYICLVIENNQGQTLIFPKGSLVQGESCSKGQYSRFAWLRPSSFKIENLRPHEINSVKILYRPLK